jgi:hypothetical protein
VHGSPNCSWDHAIKHAVSYQWYLWVFLQYKCEQRAFDEVIRGWVVHGANVHACSCLSTHLPYLCPLTPIYICPHWFSLYPFALTTLALYWRSAWCTFISLMPTCAHFCSPTLVSLHSPGSLSVLTFIHLHHWCAHLHLPTLVLAIRGPLILLLQWSRSLLSNLFMLVITHCHSCPWKTTKYIVSTLIIAELTYLVSLPLLL